MKRTIEYNEKEIKEMIIDALYHEDDSINIEKVSLIINNDVSNCGGEDGFVIHYVSCIVELK